MEKINYGGWENCYRIANDAVEVIFTSDIGPRIIRFGLLGGKNIFKEYSEQMGITQGDEWMIIGGHRLWHAPEAIPRSYYPDLEPILVQETSEGVLLTQKPEPTTGLQKQIEIKMVPGEPEVHLQHTLINHNLWAVETAPWALSVMAPGGVAILTFPERGPHPEYILPTSSLTIWPYTDLSDPRWVWGKRYFMLKQDPQKPDPQKIGIFAPDGWAAYVNDNNLFIKQVAIQFEGIYPDMGVNFEVFTNDAMLELESLGPIESIPPKGKIRHQEHWTLVEGVPTPQSEADVVANILPHLEFPHP